MKFQVGGEVPRWGMGYCKTCDLWWSRSEHYSHCTMCHEGFMGERSWDLHMPSGICRDPKSVRDKNNERKLEAIHIVELEPAVVGKGKAKAKTTTTWGRTKDSP